MTQPSRHRPLVAAPRLQFARAPTTQAVASVVNSVDLEYLTEIPCGEPPIRWPESSRVSGNASAVGPGAIVQPGATPLQSDFYIPASNCPGSTFRAWATLTMVLSEAMASARSIRLMKVRWTSARSARASWERPSSSRWVRTRRANSSASAWLPRGVRRVATSRHLPDEP
jgi:hypothetical protein